MSEKATEICFEVFAEEASVIDGYCQAKGIKRTVVMRKLLKEWSDEKHNEAIMIVRVAGDKPMTAGGIRNA